MRHVLVSVAIITLAAGTVCAPVSAQSPAPRADDCFGLGRTLGGGSWSPDGSRFVFTTSDRTTTRLESISFPGMERRVLSEADDPSFSFLAPAFIDDGHIVFGSVEGGSAWLSQMDLSDPATWDGFSIDGMEQALALEPITASGRQAIIGAIDTMIQRTLARVGLDTEDVTAIELPPEIPTRIESVASPSDGSFLFVGASDGSGVRHSWWIVRDGQATPFDFHDDVFDAYLSPDGSRVFYTSNDGANDSSLVRSLAMDGSDPRGEFRRADVKDIAVSSTGIAAFGSYVPSFDGAPSLPEPPGTNSWTPTAAFCFARTSLAAPDVAYPSAMPADDPVAEVEFADPPASVTGLVESLPRTVAGGALYWESGNYTDGAPVATRVRDAGPFTLARLVSLSAPAIPDGMFADRATLAGPDGLPSSAVLSFVSVGDDSSWLVDVVEQEIAGRDHGALVDDVTLAGRPARVITGLRQTDLPEAYAENPEYVASYRNYLWPESTTYLLPTDTAVFIISTDDRELAEKVAEAALGQ